MGVRTTQLNIAADATIISSSADDNYGGESTLIVAGSGIKRAVLIVDFAPLNRYANITSAELVLPISSQTGSGNTIISVYSIVGETLFAENEVTWNSARTGILWTEAGIKRTGQVPIGRVTITPASTEIRVDITEAAYDWHKNRVRNQGLVVVGSGSNNTVTCYSRSGNNPPYLEVEYSHHETLSQAGKESWRVEVYNRDGEKIYDDELIRAPAEIAVTQELPIETVNLSNNTRLHLLPFKLSSSDTYDPPFDSNTVDGFMFERSHITRQITLSWNVIDHVLVRQWTLWTELGCTIYLYPGKRYDVSSLNEGKGILGLDNNNVWTDWSWIDPNSNVRLWRDNVEVYNSKFPTENNWRSDERGGRFSSNSPNSFYHDFRYVCNYRLGLIPVEVLTTHSAAYRQSATASFQVVCLELDYANQQFGEYEEEGS